MFLALVSTYTLVFATLAVLRHLSFNTGGYDLGIFDQAIWNSLHGRILATSILPDVSTLLGQRFPPLLLAFVPLYAVWSNPIVLLIVQTVGFGLAAFPLYWFARARLGYLLALVVVAAFLLSPSLQFVNLAQFHEVALAVPLLAFATLFLLQHNYRAFLVCVGLNLLVKEEMAFTAAAFGIFIILVNRKRWMGFALALFGVVWGALLLQHLIPYFRGGGNGTHYYYFGSGIGAGAQGRYDYLGSSFVGVATTLITRPDIVLQHLLVPAKLEFVLHHFIPLAFVPLIGIEIAALTVPTFAISLVSDYGPQFSIRYHYTAPLLPFLFFATVIGLERILHWKGFSWLSEERYPARKWAFGVLVLVASGISYYLYAPGPFARNFEPERYVLNAHTALGSTLIRAVPNDMVVVAQTELVPHLSNRRYIYEFPTIPDYRQADYLVADTTRLWYDFHRGTWNTWLTSGYFEIITEQDDYLIARRRLPAHSVNIHYGDQMTLLGYTIMPTDTLRGGRNFQPIVEWRADENVLEHYLMHVRLVDQWGHLWSKDEREPVNGFSPTDKWALDQRVGDQYSLSLPPTMPPGDYRMTLGVYDPQADQYLAARDAAGQALGDEPVIASVRIEKDKSSILASQLFIEQPLFVDMREMRFLGYVPLRKTIVPDELMPVGLYWRAREKPRGDYLVSVQLRDASGRVVFEHASRPAHNTYPTMLWDAGEVLLDWHDFTLPQSTAMGDYQIYVVLRDDAYSSVLGETRIAGITVAR